MKKLKIVIFFIIFLSVIFIINRNYCNAIDMKKIGIGERAKIEVYTSNTSVTWIIEDESIVQRTGFSMGSSCQRLYIQALKEGTTNIYCYINGSVIFQQIIEVRNEFALDLTQDMNDYSIVWDKIKPINFGMPSKVEYTGTPIEPKIQIKFNNVYLQEGRDYVVQYENNIEVGTAKIIVTGINSCTGKKIIEFYIVKSTIEPEPNPEPQPEPQPEPEPEPKPEPEPEPEPEEPKQDDIGNNTNNENTTVNNQNNQNTTTNNNQNNQNTTTNNNQNSYNNSVINKNNNTSKLNTDISNKNDNTIASGSLPKAGLQYGIVAIIFFIIISIIFYSKYKNFKDIK